jgi:hypothetical protein
MKIETRVEDIIQLSVEKELYEYEASEKIIELIDDFAIAFHQWMRINDTKENADKYFHFTDKDMLNEFKKSL